MAKPLACPFCGETPRIGPTDYRAEGDAWASVSCDNDDCDVQPMLKNHANIAEFSAKGSAKQKRLAVAKWNKLLRSHAPTSASQE